MVPRIPADMCGYSLAYQWLDIGLQETLRYAGACADAGLNLVGPELWSYSERCLTDHPDKVMRQFNVFYRAFTAKGVAVSPIFANWNAGAGGINGGRTWCDPIYTDEWFLGMWIRLVNQPMPGMLFPEAASEFGPTSRNSKCWTKAQRWCQIAEQHFGGMMFWNYQSRPSSVPNGRYFLDEHTNTPARIVGPRGSVQRSDHSEFLKKTCGPRWAGGVNVANHGALASWARLCRRSGCGCDFYHFRSADGKPDYAAITTLGRAWHGG